MSALWQTVLPVIQDMNDYGGNFISIFISRAVLDEIEQLAAAGNPAMVSARKNLEDRARAVKNPGDHQSFSSFFECYHEALFYILALRKGVQLRAIPETRYKTPDFDTVELPAEAFEIKTIDFSGGALAYKPLMEKGLDCRIEASERAEQSSIGMDFQEIRPHGDTSNTLDAIARVMRQIAGNVKRGQFESRPTFLVVQMVRTAVRTCAEELHAKRSDPELGSEVNGHLWTIAAHRSGNTFHDATSDREAHDLGALQQAGILRDFPFIAGIIFMSVTWHALPSSDFAHPFPEDAFHMHGVWNGEYDPPNRCTRAMRKKSAFTKICDKTVSLDSTNSPEKVDYGGPPA